MKKEDFKPLDAACRNALSEWLEQSGSVSCERSWVNLLLYSDTYFWHYALLDGNLWIGSFAAGYLFFPPGGSCPPAELREVLELFTSWCGREVVCGDLPADYAVRYPEAGSLLTLEDDPGDYDYIYDLAHQNSFSGSKLRKRHNQVRQFEREYASRYTAAELTADDLPELMQLAERLSGAYWHDDSGLEEQLALKQLCGCFADRSLQTGGVTLKVDGRMAGFSVYSQLNDGLADIHFEKADRDFCGCGAKLTAVLVEHLLAHGYKRMNREQDLNLPGLRRAKQALDPDELYRRLSVTLS